MKVTSAVLLALLSGTSQAQDAVVHIGTLYARVDGAPQRNVSLIIDDGKVREIQKGFIAISAAKLEPAASLFDWSNDVVLPGLIDSHVHLDSDKAGVEAQLNQLTLSPNQFGYSRRR